jgi:hypothetical protein
MKIYVVNITSDDFDKNDLYSYESFEVNSISDYFDDIGDNSIGVFNTFGFCRATESKFIFCLDNILKSKHKDTIMNTKLGEIVRYIIRDAKLEIIL